VSLADEENVQPLLSEQDVETGEDREAPPHAQPEEGDVSTTEEPTTETETEPREGPPDEDLHESPLDDEEMKERGTVEEKDDEDDGDNGS
jgi:hypothetical protein